ncbi:MAG: calcineurin-like phosphoesterase family protein [Planctomycetota bacterium]
MIRSICRFAAPALVAALAGHAAAAKEHAKGVVYKDLNSNGVRDAGEPGLPGVRVSNGVEFATTDDSGRYEIAVTDDTIVFVVKPRGYQTPMDEHGVPRYYYIHKPDGSPDADFVFKGVAPTGPLPESIDFPLTPVRDTGRFKIFVFGDTQPYNQQQVDWLSHDVIEEIALQQRQGAGLAFGISLGDLVGDDLDLFHPLNDAIGELGVRVHSVYGNHDMNFMSPNDVHDDETFERVYGPTDYVFQQGDVHFIVLDNVRWNGFDGLRRNGRPRTGNYNGHLHEHQLEFVANYLEEVPSEELIVICTHIPMHGDDPDHRQHTTPQLPELLEILSGHPRTLSLSGHTHINQNFFFGSEMGFSPEQPGQFGEPVHHHLNLVTASGSWYRGEPDEYGIPHSTMRCGAPNGYAFIEFDGPNYRVDWRAARRDKSFQMHVHTPEVIGSDGTDGEIVANVFNGTALCSVDWKLAGGPWNQMRQDRRPDPFLQEQNAREEAQDMLDGFRRVNQAQNSSHIWVADLPSGLDGGVHTAVVRWTSIFGDVHESVRLFRVSADGSDVAAAD